MAILHVQFSCQLTKPDGSRVAGPPAIGLIQSGPRIQVTLGLAESIANTLLQTGQQPPAPIVGAAMIDTGASCTCIDDAAATQLGLPVIDVVPMISASHVNTPANVYPARIELVGSNIAVDVPRAMGAALAAQGIVVLIGRDFLQRCALFYNGVTGAITLAAG